MIDPANKPGTTSSRARFDTTRWSLVARAGHEHAQQADEALNDLCSAYWPPIYAEIRSRGYQPADAQDLTQEFFARLLRRNAFGRAEQEKGRFRSYLLAALDHFLADDWRGKRTQKRGGGAAVLSLDAEECESWFQQLAAHGSSPAESFDQRWALLVMDRALNALRTEFAESDRADTFATLLPFLSVHTEDGGYDETAARLGLTAKAVRTAVYRFRKRFRDSVRAQVEMTVADPAEAAAEMKHLFGG